MKRVPLALFVTATVAVVAIAGMMAKDRWDQWQLAKALEWQETTEWLRKRVRPANPWARISSKCL